MTSSGIFNFNREYMSPNRSNFSSLEKILTRFSFLRRKLLNHGCPFAKDSEAAIPINATINHYPKQLQHYKLSYHTERLTPEDLLQSLTRMAGEESKQRALASLDRPSSSQKAPSAPTFSRPNQTGPFSQPTNGRWADHTHCHNCKKQHPADWPFHPACKLHHTGGDGACWHLHPEKRPHSVQQKVANTTGRSRRRSRRSRSSFRRRSTAPSEKCSPTCQASS